MDKYEFKLRSEEIEKLMENGDYKSAVRLADTIDWRRVKSVATLVRIADLYRHNKRFEESRDLLEIAYDRNPVSRNVIYGLCEISLEFGDIVAAIEYFKEFVKIAPNDVGVYILRYRIYEAQNVGFEDRIELLEELKKKDRMEEWEYQLAYLYHRAGFATKCVEECDEIILWFGEGPYVVKAMELKMLHEPLTPSQQEKYDRRNESKIEEAARAAMERNGSNSVEEDDDFRVKTIDMSKFNTMNLQAELAENLKEFIEEEPTPVVPYPTSPETLIIRGEKEVFHNTIPADANEVFFADKTEDMRYAIPEPEPVSGATPEMTAFKENYAREMQATGGRDVQEIHMEEEPAVSMESLLMQQSDGQISLTEPDEKPVEKQITGQMNIADILEGWERMKKENTQRFQEEVRKQLLEQTGEMFAEFDVNSKSGMLSTLDDPSKLDEVVAPVSATVMKGLDESAVTPIAEAVPGDTIANVTVVELLSELGEGGYEQIVPQKEAVAQDVPVAGDSVTKEEEPVAQAAESVAEDSENVKEDIEEVHEVTEEYETAEEEAEEAYEEAEEEAEEAYEAAEEETEEAYEAAGEEAEEVYEATEEETEEDDYVQPMTTSSVTDTIPGGIWKEVENSIADDAKMNQVESMVEEDAMLQELAEEEPIREVKAVNDLTPEEKELFAQFIYSKKMKAQLIDTLENITLAAYSGNVLISAESSETAVELAKKIVRHVQMTDGNFSGKVAKISAENLNKKSVEDTLEKLVNGALLIENASEMKKETIKNLLQGLNQDNTGILVILMDKKNGIQKLMDKIPYMKDFFTGRVDIIQMSMDMLISYSVKYARTQGYVIDDMGHLALSKSISERRRGNHAITVEEAKELMDEAIRRSKKRKLFGKARKNEDGYVLLKEKDFE